MVPIRKVSESRVALTSYYGKVFINRSDRSTDDYSSWLSRKISKFSLDVRDGRVIEGRMGKNPIPKVRLPRDFTAIMTKISGFKTGSFVFNFEFLRRKDLYLEEELKEASKLGMTPCGRAAGKLLLMDKNSIIHILKPSGLTELSSIRDIIGGEWGKVPVDKAIVSVFGKKTPLGLILGRWLGLEALIKRTKIKYRKVPSNVRSSVEDSEFVVKFKDFHYYFDKSNIEATMILAGFTAVSKQLELYNSHEFEKPEVYTTILLNHGLHTLAIREIRLIRDGFVDHITEEILKDMGEPTKIIDLFFRSVELLRDDVAPDETDPSLMRIRGYERISGFLYKTFVDAVRVQRGSPNPKNAALDIRINSVWQMLVGDATTQLAQSINPVHSTKEQEGVSLSGEGGRSATSLVQRTRVFHKDDVGIFSESTPDSAKVAVRTFLTPNAAIKNTRGMLGKYDRDNGTAGALSTTSNILPAANHDDKFSVVDKSL